MQWSKTYNLTIVVGFYYVELVTSQEVRLQRNISQNRLKYKASKRHIEASNKRLIDADCNHRCVSNDGEVTFDNYIKIDNSEFSAEQVAKMIKARFDL